MFNKLKLERPRPGPQWARIMQDPSPDSGAVALSHLQTGRAATMPGSSRLMSGPRARPVTGPGARPGPDQGRTSERPSGRATRQT